MLAAVETAGRDPAEGAIVKSTSLLLISVFSAHSVMSCSSSTSEPGGGGGASGANHGTSGTNGAGGAAQNGGAAAANGGHEQGSGGQPNTGGRQGSGSSGASGSAGMPSTGGTGSGGSGGVPSSAGGCPIEQPTNGASCSGSIGPCTYGDHPFLYCRASAACSGGHWMVTPVPVACTQLSAGCPASPSTGLCSVASDVACVYPSAQCACYACCSGPAGSCTHAPGCGNQPDGTHVWSCGTAPRLNPPPCPAVTPNQGTGCDLPSGTECLSEPCGLHVTCENAVWVWNYISHGPECMVVCASPDTPIETPDGERPISALRVGDLVYSVDGNAIRAVPVARTRRVPVQHHHVLRIVLDDGSELEISPLHPTADGRPLSALVVGDVLGERRVASMALVPYTHDATYDILPASSTGTYFAKGALMGSTLTPLQNAHAVSESDPLRN